MAGDNGRMFTMDETLRAINEKSKEVDNFVIKVMRRNGGLGSLPSLIASFSDASVQHLISPELWVPDLAGGGKFTLQAFHASDLNKPVAGALAFNLDGQEPRDVDSAVTKKPNWRGPTTLEFPKESARVQTEDLGPMYSAHSPPAPGSGDSATRSNQAWVRQAGGGVQRQEYAGPNGELFGPFGPKAAALESERRELERTRRDLDLEKHKAELENTKKQHEASMLAFEAKIQASLTQLKPSGPDPMIQMLVEMNKQAAEDRRAQLQLAAEDRRAEEARRTEERRSERERQDRADERFLKLLTSLNEKPKENPLETFKAFSELMGAKKDNGIIEAQAKMLHSMSEMTSHQISTAMDFVNAAADLQLGARGEEEPGWVKGIDRVLKGVGAIAKGRAQAAPVPQVPQQLAPGQQPPPQQQQPQRPPPQTDKSVIVQIEEAVRAKLPPQEIAKAIIANVQEPSMQKALIESGMDFEVAFFKRLGNWHLEAPSNAEYLKVLFAETKTQAIVAGLLAPEPAPQQAAAQEEGDEGGEGEDDGSDDEGDEVEE